MILELSTEKKYTEKLVRNDIGTGNRKEVYREKCKE